MKKANQDQLDTDVEKRRYETTLERPPRPDLRRDHAPVRDGDIQSEKIKKRDDMGGTSVYRKKNPEKVSMKDKKEPSEGSIRSMNGFTPKKDNFEKLLSVEAKLDICLKFLSQAMSEFYALKSIDISPDGKLGGRGFVLDIKEIRSILYQSVDSISLLIDTLYDETHGEHWDWNKGQTKEPKQEPEQREDVTKQDDIAKVSSILNLVRATIK